MAGCTSDSSRNLTGNPRSTRNMLVYRLLNFLLLPLTLTYIIWKALRHRQLRYLLQRLGLGLRGIPQHCVWLHCASVGEVNTALPLIAELHKRNPEQNFLITTNTPTGASIVIKQNQPYLYHAYLPFDWVLSVSLFITRLHPACLYVLETELWPNLFSLCDRAGVPITILNGRLSSKTTTTFKWVRQVLGQLLSKTKHIYARSEADRNAFIKLGATTDKVTQLGNLKYAPPSGSVNNKPDVDIAYVVVASTHDNEEEQIADLWFKLNRNELLVIAPRHPERRDDIIRQLSVLSDAIAVRSKNDPITTATRIYLLDTVGELNGWFSDARLVVMGGTFVPKGGHNLLEPAHFGKAVIFGPDMKNFEEEARLMLDNHAAIQVDSIDELGDKLCLLLDDAVALESLENNVKQASAKFAHIVADYADRLSQQQKQSV